MEKIKWKIMYQSGTVHYMECYLHPFCYAMSQVWPEILYQLRLEFWNAHNQLSIQCSAVTSSYRSSKVFAYSLFRSVHLKLYISSISDLVIICKINYTFVKKNNKNKKKKENETFLFLNFVCSKSLLLETWGWKVKFIFYSFIFTGSSGSQWQRNPIDCFRQRNSIVSH